MKSKVYFIKASVKDGESILSEKAAKLFKAAGFAACFKENDFTALKVHVGEDTNKTYIKSPCLKGLVAELQSLKTKPFVTDTSTLYRGRRHNAIDHAILAHEHGFDIVGLGIPFIAPDGLFGTSESAVEVNGDINKEVLIADDIVRCQSILSVAHMTGHIATCAAATLKTLGMGCASRKGKMRQHSALKPKINDTCKACGVCGQHCPADAITIADVKAHIDADKCIGCGECVAMCRFGAVEWDWNFDDLPKLQKDMVEHACGALKGKQAKAAFFNFAISITNNCDCYNCVEQDVMTQDLGIFASTDPVAVDAATIDMVQKAANKTVSQLINNPALDHRPQLEHAVKIGLGSMDYELVEIASPF